jgi:hypothetical protein
MSASHDVERYRITPRKSGSIRGYAGATCQVSENSLPVNDRISLTHQSRNQSGERSDPVQVGHPTLAQNM